MWLPHTIITLVTQRTHTALLTERPSTTVHISPTLPTHERSTQTISCSSLMQARPHNSVARCAPVASYERNFLIHIPMRPELEKYCRDPPRTIWNFFLAPFCFWLLFWGFSILETYCMSWEKKILQLRTWMPTGRTELHEMCPQSCKIGLWDLFRDEHNIDSGKCTRVPLEINQTKNCCAQYPWCNSKVLYVSRWNVQSTKVCQRRWFGSVLYHACVKLKNHITIH